MNQNVQLTLIQRRFLDAMCLNKGRPRTTLRDLGTA